LNRYDIDESFYDISVKNAWYLPTFKSFFSKGRSVFVNPNPADNKLRNEINQAISLTEEAKSFEEGNRNRFIYLLGRNSNRLGIEMEDLLNYILDSDFYYDESEIRAAINSAYKKTEDFGIWKGRSDIDNSTVSLQSLFKRAKNTMPIPVIWSGIKEGGLGFVFGPAKSGKSTLCECLAMSLETGMDSFLGLPLTGKKYKVLYISMEEYWEQRVERNRRQRTYLYKSFKKKLGGNYFTNNEKFPTHFINDSDLKYIESEINKHEPQIVFIDSFTRLVLEKVEYSTRTNKVMSKLKQMCRDTGATFVLIHHTIKSKDKLLTITDMAGSRVLSQEADFLIGITRAANDRRYMKDIAFRYAPEREKITPFEINESLWVIPGKVTNEAELIKRKDGRKDDSNKLAIFDFIKSSDGPVSSLDIKDHFAEAMSKKTIFNNLNKLQDEESIERVGKGLYKCSVDNKEY
jgi:KaiC/GvpD/RAD55 family RecA-like ATPase